MHFHHQLLPSSLRLDAFFVALAVSSFGAHQTNNKYHMSQAALNPPVSTGSDKDYFNNCIGSLEHHVHNVFASVRVPGEGLKLNSHVFATDDFKMNFLSRRFCLQCFNGFIQ